MNFALSSEEKQVVEAVRQLSRAQFAPHASEYDRTGAFPWPNFHALAEHGFTGMTVDPELGGAGASFLAYAACVEEIARACATTAVLFEVHNSLHIEPIVRFGTKRQHETILPPLIRGERLGAFCLTEPTSGSDAGALKTSATRTDKGWTISGQKGFVTNGSVADEYLVFARTDPDAPKRAISAFLVDKETPGLTFGPPEEKLGLRASSTTAVYLDGVEVDGDHLLGEVGDGLRIALATLDAGRIGIAAQAVGVAQAALDAVVEYAKQRRQFGRPIAQFQGVEWLLAEMAVDLEASRLLLYRAAWLYGEGQRATSEIATAKLHASTMANRHIPRVLRVLGGYGYLKDFPLERHLRDAKITEIYEGTSEVMKLIVASHLLNMRLLPDAHS